jgi:hypothetical protein
MVDYDIPFESQWKEIVILGKTKYKIPASNWPWRFIQVALYNSKES